MMQTNSIPTVGTEPRLHGKIVLVEELSNEQRDQMFELMTRYYENVRRTDFNSDLDEKDWALIAWNPDNRRILGFSTQTTYQQVMEGKKVRLLFSGDTIVDQRYWAKHPLWRLWGRLALSLIDACPHDPMYWFLISKGYKTYRFLPLFFNEFYPRRDRESPLEIQRLIAHAAKHRFGDRYEESSGILKARPEDVRLRRSVADVTKDRLKDRDVEFFHRMNPGHADGDELCCVAPLTRENFARTAYRVIGTDYDPIPVSHIVSRDP